MTLSFENTLTNIKQLEIIGDGIRLDDLINQEFVEKLKEKIPGYEIRFTEININLLLKEDMRLVKKMQSEMQENDVELKQIDDISKLKIGLHIENLNLKHRNENDYQKYRIVVDSTDEELLNDFLNVFGEK